MSEFHPHISLIISLRCGIQDGKSFSLRNLKAILQSIEVDKSNAIMTPDLVKSVLGTKWEKKPRVALFNCPVLSKFLDPS